MLPCSCTRRRSPAPNGVIWAVHCRLHAPSRGHKPLQHHDWPWLLKPCRKLRSFFNIWINLTMPNLAQCSTAHRERVPGQARHQVRWFWRQYFRLIKSRRHFWLRSNTQLDRDDWVQFVMHNCNSRMGKPLKLIVTEGYSRAVTHPCSMSILVRLPTGR